MRSKDIHTISVLIITGLVLFLDLPLWVEIPVGICILFLVAVSTLTLTDVLANRKAGKQAAEKLHSVATNEAGNFVILKRLSEYVDVIYMKVRASKDPAMDREVQKELAKFEHLIARRRKWYKVSDKKREQLLQAAEDSVVKLAEGKITPNDFLEMQKRIQDVYRFQ
jgi:hypothetical protein